MILWGNERFGVMIVVVGANLFSELVPSACVLSELSVAFPGMDMPRLTLAHFC